MKKINLHLLSDIEVYEFVLRGELRAFPPHFWEKPDSLQSSKKLIIYLLEEKLKWSVEDIKENLSQRTFKENKLGGMLQRVFKGSPYSALENAYPGRYKEWELNHVPKKFWNKEKAFRSIKWLLEEKYKFTDEDIKKYYCKEFVINNGLFTALVHLKMTSFEIINTLYPNKFRPWEFKQVPIKYWDSETIAESIRWFIDEKMKWSEEEVKEKLTVDFLERNGLSGVINYATKNHIGIYTLIDWAYPGKYKEWEFIKVSEWTKDKAIQATIWLIKDCLKWELERVNKEIKQYHFFDNDLNGMLNGVYKGSPYLALKSAYPLHDWESLRSKFK